MGRNKWGEIRENEETYIFVKSQIRKKPNKFSLTSFMKPSPTITQRN